MASHGAVCVNTELLNVEAWRLIRMQTTYKTYYSFCVAQFACGVFLMWLGYRIDLHFLTLRPTDVPLIELYESHVTPLMCSAALRARNRSWIAHEHFVVEKDFMSLKACYVLTCGLASCIAVIFFNSSSEPDSEEDTDDRLKPLWDIAFGFFIVLHSLTFGALSTGALAVFEQYLFLSLGHAVTIIIICTVPRESVMVLGGGFLYAAVMTDTLSPLS